jgi:aminoglycoside 6'-N-acetyltransferase-1b/aminoglycoside 6'-N-acetyltransferase-2
MAASTPNGAPCWCTRAVFSTELLAAVPPFAQGKACICARCVVASQQAGASAEAADDDNGSRAAADREFPAVTLRPMTDDDIPMLHDWLARPHIARWWRGHEQRQATLDETRAQYRAEVLANERVTPYIAMLGDDAIGYAQSYVALASGDGWWEDETDPGVRGIDQSLARPELLGKGLGTKLASALVELLFSDPGVTTIQTDPSPDNPRAIRCYEKAGFRKVKMVTTPDGPAVYMVRTRSSSDPSTTR